MKYRADIDGLRAFAILPILFFHAHVGGFDGGYVGVDIFFVISGYLITTILTENLKGGNFSIAVFYERRLRRIAPALLTVLLFVLLVSPFSLLPSELEVLGRETLGALFFVANITFWLASGYFEADAEAKPLLHTWSLGVEEQFYLFVPLWLWIVFRYMPRHKVVAIAVPLIASLAACVYLTPHRPNPSFYLLPTRAWELLSGSLLAMLASRRSSEPRSVDWTSESLAAVGFCLIITPIFLYDSTIQFPGYAAVPPVIGVMLLIRYAADTAVGRFLSLRFLVFVGHISYSLYLWHWPLIVFFRSAGWLDQVPGRMAVIALSLLMAWLSFRFIETPTRNRNIYPTKRLVRGSAVGAMLVCVGSIVYSQTHGMPARFPEQVVAYDQARHDASAYHQTCNLSDSGKRVEDACHLGDDNPAVAVWSDSHGFELAQAIHDSRIPVLAYTATGCLPVASQPFLSRDVRCGQRNLKIFDLLMKDKKIHTVVLAAFYKHDLEKLKAVARTANALVAGGKKVVVVGPTPRIGDEANIPTYLARGGERYATYDDFEEQDFREYFSSQVEFVFPENLFCDSTRRCDMSPNDHALLFDDDHPSLHTARITAVRVIELIRHNEDLQSGQ